MVRKYQKIKQQHSRMPTLNTAQKLHLVGVRRIEKEICKASKHRGEIKTAFPRSSLSNIFGGAKSNRLPFWRLVVTDVTKAKKPFFTC